MTDLVEAALARLGTPADVLERHHITIRRRMARCPFHDDSTPSMSLYMGRDNRPRWKCHGCGAGGDAIDLEARLRGISVHDVLLEYKEHRQ